MALDLTDENVLRFVEARDYVTLAELQRQFAGFKGDKVVATARNVARQHGWPVSDVDFEPVCRPRRVRALSAPR